MYRLTVIFILLLHIIIISSSLQLNNNNNITKCANSECRAVKNNKQVVDDDDDDALIDNPITNFFSSIYTFLTNGITSLFGGDERPPTSKRKSYKDFQLIQAVPRTQDQLLEMKGIEEEFEGVKFWSQPHQKNGSCDVLVPPNLADNVKDFLRERQINYKVLTADLQRMIARQNPKMTKERRDQLKDTMGHHMTWRRYHRYTDILTYLDFLESTYPNMVSVHKIGKSSGGRPLRLARVFSPTAKRDDPPKPAIWIDGGTHAREWISPAVAVYILKQLVENYKVNKQVVLAYDWYILPVANPDGYEYSHTTDRLWRKTRSNAEDEGRGSRVSRIFFGSCEGVDPNRNWDFHWGERGASDDPCDETYAGPNAFSEPETKAIADFIMQRKDEMKVFLTLHSYGQMWLLPWGYTREKMEDHEDLMEMGQTAVDALAKVDGTKYKLGAATDLLYHSSGGADDWAKGKAGIKYAYTVELRDTGAYGFLLPASQIIPTGKETFAAIKTMVRSMMPVKKVVKRPATASVIDPEEAVFDGPGPLRNAGKTTPTKPSKPAPTKASTAATTGDGTTASTKASTAAPTKASTAAPIRVSTAAAKPRPTIRTNPKISKNNAVNKTITTNVNKNARPAS